MGADLKRFNHFMDLLGRPLAAMCQLPHLVRHYRNPPARLPCSRSLNGCVECQQIGLLGNAVNHFEDAADGLGLAA